MATLDTSMYRNPLRSVADFETEYGQADLQKQNLLKNKLMLDSEIRARDEAEALKGVVKGFGPDVQANAGLIRSKTGNLDASQKYLKSEADIEKERRQAEKTAQEAKALKMQGHRDALNLTVHAPQDLANWITVVYKDFPELEQQAPLEKVVATILNATPEQFQALKWGMAQQAKDAIENDLKKRQLDQTITNANRQAANEVMVFDPVTKTWVVNKPLVEAKGQIARSGASSINQYGGMVAGVDPKTGKPAFGVTDKQGNFKMVEGFQPPEKAPKEEKNLTEDQGKATSWLERMNQAEEIVNKAPDEALKSTGSKGAMTGAVIGSVPFVGESSFGKMARSAVESPARQAVRTAQETWVQGLLRSDTGAAYKDMEKDDIIRTFFWQPGEDESQKAIKQGLRDGVRRAMQVRAGPGVERLEKVPKVAPSQTPSSPPVSALKEGAVTTFRNGQKWTLQGGKPVKVE